MLVSVNGGVATDYDDFKLLIANLAPNGADIFYQGTTNLRRIWGVVRGEPGCKGEFPLAITHAADLVTFSISVSGVVLVDFPSAVEVKSPLVITT